MPDSSKAFANHIAGAAVSEDAVQLVRLLRLSGYLGGPSSTISALDLDDAFTSPSASPSDRIGIWERKVANGKVSFVRRMEAMPEWIYWANLSRIEPKGEKPRVLLIGESVARGYLYDPVFTPALALQIILESQFGEGGIEVIDLARTNLGFQVNELAIAALELEPDIAVIFGGNNWCVSEPRPSEVVEIDAAISKQGIAGAKQAADAQIARNARRVVSSISAAYASKGIPLVWIIPEFNLADWRDPMTNAPYLADGLNNEWLKLLEEAQSAMREGDFTRSMTMARRMIEIDRGVCLTGFQILAECSRQTDAREDERKYLELARDAASWDLSRMPIPRPYSVMQEAVRDEAGKHQGEVVDLPALFKEYLDGEIPGRRLFLDYCHLTTEGIQVAMGAAASCVLRKLKGVEMPWFALVSDRVAPAPEIEAEASFLAAIMNGHCSQSYDVVHHFCARALNLSRHVAELMLNYIELQTQRSIPMRMSEAEEQMSRLGSPLIRHYLLRLNDKRLDKLLLNAIVNALEEVGIEARERLEQIWREEHSVSLSEINLLDYYYCSAAEQQQELASLNRDEEKRHRPDGDYYRAYWPESRFVFVGEAGCPVHLCLTCRLPKSESREKSINLMLNGKPQVKIAISSEWSTWDIELPGDEVQEALNEIALHWPIPEFESSKVLEKARLSLYERKFAEFYPVFGEIHSFKASNGLEVTTHLPAAQTEFAAAEV